MWTQIKFDEVSIFYIIFWNIHTFLFEMEEIFP